jgi:hypothetical protein
MVHPHLIANPLVGLEVERQLGVVSLNNDLGGLLDGLCANATHFGDCVCVGGEGREWAVGVVVEFVGRRWRIAKLQANVVGARLRVMVRAHASWFKA